MVAARRIVVIGMRNAIRRRCICASSCCRPAARCVVLPQPVRRLSEELVDLTADDLVVMMAFAAGRE